MTNLKDFINNWNINIKEKSATHKSGLKFAYISNSIDGNSKIEMSQFSKWVKFCKLQGIGGQDIYMLQQKLHSEFVQIYNNVITVSNLKVLKYSDNSK